MFFNIQLFFNNIVLTKQFPIFWEIISGFRKKVSSVTAFSVYYDCFVLVVFFILFTRAFYSLMNVLYSDENNFNVNMVNLNIMSTS